MQLTFAPGGERAATMKQLVRVTQDDIDNGEPESGCNCPVALAIIRGWPWPRHESDFLVEVSTFMVEAWPGIGVRYEAKVPPVAQGFIAEFDDGGRDRVGPFTFELEWELSA